MFENLKIAIIGGRGISNVHLRILKTFGISEFALVSSSFERAKFNCDEIFINHAVRVTPFKSSEQLINSFGPDGVLICSTPETHFRYLSDFLSANIPVFCEKPLIWSDPINSAILNNNLEELKSISEKFLLNTSNRYFIDTIKKCYSFVPDDIGSFKFVFHTHGNHQFSNIGVDLVPHAVSIMHELFGVRLIEGLETSIGSTFYNCFFNYGSSRVEFELIENKEFEKAFLIKIDKTTFERVQEGFGGSYRVHIKNLVSGTTHPVEDPFLTHLRKFLENILFNKFSDRNDFIHAQNNMRHLVQIISG